MGIRQQQQVQIQVLHALQEYTDEEGRDDEICWLESWIPVAYDGSGDLLCVDVVPPSSEQFGQIIFFDHEAGNRRIAPNFHALLSRFADDLEAGKYSLDAFGRLRSGQSLFIQSQLPSDSISSKSS